MARESWSFSFCSMRGHAGLAAVLMRPHFICWAKPFRIGLALNVAGSSSSDTRVGSSEPGWAFVPIAITRAFCGAERNSIHFQAASLFLLELRMVSASPAIVVPHCLSFGSGATLHLPLILGNCSSSVEANQAPASYIATVPWANVTRPSHEFELYWSGGEYLASPV